MTGPGRHEAATTNPVGTRQDGPDVAPAGLVAPGFRAELADAINPRTVLMVFAVLLLQLGFILSYVGAFHTPKPHRISLAVVAPAEVAGRTSDQLNGIASAPLRARTLPDEATAVARLRDGALSSALILDPSGTTDRLLVSTAGGTAVATAVENVVSAAEATQRRSIAVTDVVPLQPGDGRGLTGFYLVIGWIVGGYLVAALLGVARGARPANLRRAVIRLLSTVPYAILSGLGGALIVDQVLGALTGHLLALWWLGALLVLAAAAVTMALQIMFGVIGIGLTVLIFVVLGNPSAGGAYQPALLPPFWRALSGALPNGAGTDSVRRIVYFHGNGIGGHLVVIALYAVAGAVAALAVSGLRSGGDQPG
jgi:hypothetical protein